METLFSIHSIIPFLTLLALELVLGIDNIIFISIISDRLPENQRRKARTIGLSLAIITRLLLMLSLSWIMGLTAPLFTIFSQEISGRDLILILGGLFLIAKSTHEIHQKLESSDEIALNQKKASFTFIIFQILLLDLVFSLDSVITAVGMVNEIPIMFAAIIVSTIIMIMASHSIAGFIDKHPTIKLLALSFLVLIGVALLAEGFDTHIPKGYIYFSMAYALAVEFLNIRLRKKKETIHSKKTAKLKK
ncbi:MAG TPA: TerC family protein [Parachlamydiaceae bacterium]|nr:TerC family protein [Parachlamydiaceae bacterium]